MPVDKYPPIHYTKCIFCIMDGGEGQSISFMGTKSLVLLNLSSQEQKYS